MITVSVLGAGLEAVNQGWGVDNQVTYQRVSVLALIGRARRVDGRGAPWMFPSAVLSTVHGAGKYPLGDECLAAGIRHDREGCEDMVGEVGYGD
jgi:hypothetical protein